MVDQLVVQTDEKLVQSMDKQKAAKLGKPRVEQLDDQLAG
jgi:hypothetical protein